MRMYIKPEPILLEALRLIEPNRRQPFPIVPIIEPTKNRKRLFLSFILHKDPHFLFTLLPVLQQVNDPVFHMAEWLTFLPKLFFYGLCQVRHFYEVDKHDDLCWGDSVGKESVFCW